MRVLQLGNRDMRYKINLRLLRGMVRFLLQDKLNLSDYEIAVHLVTTEEIISLNETFLRHAGPTDVITFGYPCAANGIHGEIFVCVSEAVRQAPRFHQPWQSELLRYVVHGVLHLQGYDDDLPAKKRVMRRKENQCIDLLSKRYDLQELASFKEEDSN